MYQVFKFKYVIVYVEGYDKYNALKLIEEHYTKEIGVYMGEYATLEDVLRCEDGLFIEGYHIENGRFEEYIQCNMFKFK